MQKIIYLNEISEYTEFIDPAVADYIAEGQIETFESFENFDIIAFDWYNIYDLSRDGAQIMVYLDRDDLFVLCENDVAYDKAMSIFREAPTNERALYLFFISLMKGDAKLLERTEDDVCETEDRIITDAGICGADEIVRYRRNMLQLGKYYEQLDSIFEELCENDNGLLSEQSLKYFEVLGSRTDRLLRTTKALREYVTQVREAYQAQIDIEQNQIMKVLTIVTAIFMPLSLLVGWYGMNFMNMPELAVPWAYPLFTAVSALICAVLIIYFKRKKWF